MTRTAVFSFFSVLTFLLPPVNLYPSAPGLGIEMRSKTIPGLEDAVNEINLSPDSESSKLLVRELIPWPDNRRIVHPSQSFQVANLPQTASTNGSSLLANSDYYQLLVLFMDFLSACTKTVRDRLIRWRLALATDPCEVEYLKKLLNSAPGRAPNPTNGQGTIWRTGWRFPHSPPYRGPSGSGIDIR